MKTCTVKAWDAIRELIDVNKVHFKEIKDLELPRNAILIDYRQASYGDWCYWVTPSGEYVCTYYSIGD